MALESPRVVLPVSPCDGVQLSQRIRRDQTLVPVQFTPQQQSNYIVSQVKSFSCLFHFILTRFFLNVKLIESVEKMRRNNNLGKN